MLVSPKKSLGQHFLKDENIAIKIVNSLSFHNNYITLLEVGPGMGILTKFLLEIKNIDLWLIDIDKEATEFLMLKFPNIQQKIINADFLKFNFNIVFDKPIGIIGNFPYNISSQILFKVLQHRNMVNEVVGMFQQEVALRIASKPGNKNYGILSVLLQAFYDIEYIFSVPPHVFYPAPKVKSGVLRLTRNNKKYLDCDENIFFIIVKTAFNQRRKILRNALSKYKLKNISNELDILLSKRAEQLNVDEFVSLTNNLIPKSLD
jgi:16S rRNA (adenine1518-N6/adenine1519-N6)-dimethyltransferase